MTVTCPHCGQESLSAEDLHCLACGGRLPTERERAMAMAKFLRAQGLLCEKCGTPAPTYPVLFNKNIGMLIARQQATIQGRLCRKCIGSAFGEFQLTNLFLGWWGITSFFATLIFLVTNTISYGKSWKYFRELESADRAGAQTLS